MANLRGIVSKLASGRGAAGGGRRRATTGGAGTGTPGTAGTSGRRTQDEAIGRGVRGLVSRFRR